MIECVSLGTSDYFDGNPIAGALQLRYQELVEKEKWANINVQPDNRGAIEYDEFDTPATRYLIKRDEEGRVIATGRVKPTTGNYMLSGVFKDLLTDAPTHSPLMVEGSRVVIDRENIPKEKRIAVVDEIIMAYFECSEYMGAKEMVAFMLPKVWKATFIRLGWKPEWIGPECVIDHSGEVVRAGTLPVNSQVEEILRKRTGLYTPVLDFGRDPNPKYPGASYLSSYEKLDIRPAEKATPQPVQRPAASPVEREKIAS